MQKSSRNRTKCQVAADAGCFSRFAIRCQHSGFLGAAVRKSASEVPLRFIDALRFAPDIVRSQPRTASLLSGNSVLRADFIRRSEADSVSTDLQSAACSPAAGGARPPAVRTIARPYTAGRPTLPRLVSVFQRFCAGRARGEPPTILPAARVRRTAADNKPASTCCVLQISVNLQSCPVRPLTAFSGVRLMRILVL